MNPSEPPSEPAAQPAAQPAEPDALGLGAPAASPTDERFSRSLRLRRSADFRRVQRGGDRFHTAHLVAIHRSNDVGGPRFGLAVSRKVGNAVNRNRVKRWLREAVRRSPRPTAAVDVVFIAKPGAADAGYAVLSSEVRAALARVRS